MSSRPRHPYPLSVHPGNRHSRETSPRLHTIGGGNHPNTPSAGSSGSEVANTHQTSMFSGNSVVHGGSFTINMGSPDEGILLLSKAASKEAMHDSSAREPPPKCHPETRTKIVNFFLDWAKSQYPIKLVYWLHAPFGHGKSAVVQTIVDQLVADGRQDLIAGTFFFGRGKPGRDQARYLLPTIAYQIALNIPGMRQYINAAMMADPTLPSSSLKIQLRALIVEPLLKCNGGPHFNHPPTVFIDGLDECDTIENQVAVLDLVATALHVHHVPLRFLVASRPETHIRDAFDEPNFGHYYDEILLPDNDFEMTTCLRQKFDEIYDHRARLMKLARIPKPWPSPAQIDDLVERACGQYIFLDTITRFVDTPRLDPATQLEIVCCRLSNSSVFTNMDSIYRLVLEQCPYQHILEVFILHWRCFDLSDINLFSIAEMWQFPMAQVQLTAESLAAIGWIDDYSGFRAHHLSFIEFLEDADRSGEFFITGDVVERWNRDVLEAFKLALSGELTIQNERSVEHFNTLPERPGLYDRALYSQMQELTCQGLVRGLEGQELVHWYHVVGVLLVHYCLAEESDDILVTGFVRTLRREIWKKVSGGAFEKLSKINPRLAEVLLTLSVEGATVKAVAELAMMDVQACAELLQKFCVLFAFVEGDHMYLLTRSFTRSRLHCSDGVSSLIPNISFAKT